MVLLRRVIGDALRARRQAQHRTLRQVSTAANVSLGYLSEIERGQKEASSELLSAICDALGAHLSDLLRDVSQTVALEEQVAGVLVPMPEVPAGDAPVIEPVGADAPVGAEVPVAVEPVAVEVPVASVRPVPAASGRPVPVLRPVPRKVRDKAVLELSEQVNDGVVSVTVRRDSPLKTTLLATRMRERSRGDQGREPVSVG
jgi:transcriptional regulator with XRE-family HTH domain